MAKKPKRKFPWCLMRLILMAALFFGAESTCKNEMTRTGFKLDVGAISTMPGSTLISCYMACHDNEFCQGYNLDFWSWACHLLNTSVTTQPDKLIPAMNWAYMTSPRHTCSSNPCHGGGTCTGPSDNITCLCDMYHKGDRCQHKLTFPNCSSIKAANPTAPDGQYFINPTLYPTMRLNVYCSDMKTNPSEWLTVNRKNNVVFWSPRQYKSPTQCGGEYNQGYSYGLAGHVQWSKVKININDLAINNEYNSLTNKFANLISGNGRDYGTAGDCHGTAICPLGYFKIDLTGTCARFRDSVKWVKNGDGSSSQISMIINISSNRTIVSGKCGGYCAGCKPESKLLIEPTGDCN